MLIFNTFYTSSRLNYILQYLERRIGIKIEINSNSALVGYGIEGAVLSISDLGLLRDGAEFSSEIVKPLLSDVIKFLDGADTSQHWPDVFSLMFWYLARVEEYGQFKGDQHSRFTSQDTICREFDVIRRPIVDEIVNKIIHKLGQNGVKCVPEKLNHLSTIDIDQPFAYAHKGLRVILGAIKDIFKGNFQTLKWRLTSFISAYDDPYFSYEYIYDVHANYKLKPKVFILSSYNKHELDINHDPEDSPYRVVINMLDSQYDIGIHPSYFSSIETTQVNVEKIRLQNIIGREVTSSRQHFLRLTLPKTYHVLLTAGIKNDYTMGFADDIGYRAGTGHSFAWYDLETESETSLIIHPFSIMDVTLKDYLGYSPNRAIEECARLFERAEAVDSPITIIWHNSSLHALGGWHDWKDVYKNLLARMSKTNIE